MRGQAAPEPAGDVLDERRVGQDEAVAEAAVSGALELLPENARVSRFVGHRKERIRCLAERPVGKLAHPDCERRARDRDHPRAAAGARRVDSDRREADSENAEQGAEGSPSHPGIMRFA